jgi:hypothetical protein
MKHKKPKALSLIFDGRSTRFPEHTAKSINFMQGIYRKFIQVLLVDVGGDKIDASRKRPTILRG